MANILFASSNTPERGEVLATLESLGHQVIVVGNEDEVMACIEATSFDLFIIDETMSSRDGFEFSKKLKEHERGFAIPLIILLEDKSDNLMDSVNAGADYYLVKPIQDTHLAATLKASLKSAISHRVDFDIFHRGTIFAGRYVIKMILGYGKHAVVFLATDQRRGNQDVALKLMNREFTGSPTAKKFLTIAERVQGIDAPTIIKIFDFGEAEGRIYLTMEYAERSDVMLHFKRRNFPEPKAVNMGLDILISLKLFKDHGISHLAVNPRNILRSGNRYKLASFGIPLEYTGEQSIDISDVWNDPAYAAPEHLFAANQITSQNDLYSLGVTLYQAVTGDNPFDGDKLALTVSRHMNLTPPPPREYNSGISKYFSEGVMSTLIKDPDKRPELEEMIKYFVQLKEYLDYYYAQFKKPTAQKLKPTDTIELSAEEATAIRNAVETSSKAQENLEQMEPYISRNKWRLLSIEGEPLEKYFSKRTILAAGILLLILLTATIVVGFTVRRVLYDSLLPANLKAGPMSIIRCFKCGFTREQRFRNIEEVKCVKCSSDVGYALKCNDCGAVFPQRRVSGKGMSNAEIIRANYSCPECESMNTQALLTASEKRLEKSITPKSTTEPKALFQP